MRGRQLQEIYTNAYTEMARGSSDRFNVWRGAGTYPIQANFMNDITVRTASAVDH